MSDVEEDHEMQNPSSDPVPAEEDEDMEEVPAPTKQARVAQQDIGEEEEEGGDEDEEDGGIRIRTRSQRAVECVLSF